jgi:general secretion pathway protein L
MRKQLFIRMPQGYAAASAAEAPASWIVRDEDRPAGSLVHGNLSQAAAQAAGAHVAVLVPSSDVVLAQVTMPAMKQQRLAKAVPFALEEQLAEDVDELHVAVGQRDTEGKVANAVVARDRLDDWLAQLKSVGLQADVISPELFGVQWDKTVDQGTWSMVVNAGQALLRTGAQTGLAFDRENLIPVMHACLDEAGEAAPSRLTVVSCDDSGFVDSDAHRALSAWCSEQTIDLSLREEDAACSVVLAQGFNENTAINLLQGDYSRKQQLEKLLRPWRPALILAAVWLLLQVGMLVTDYGRLSSQSQALQAQIEKVYRQAFPGSRLVPGQEKELMRRGLEKLRGGGADNSGLLSLLAGAGAVLKDTAGAELRSLRFKDNQLDVDVNMPDLQALDALKQRLTAEAKLQVEIVSASSRDGKVESRLSLKGGGQ